MFSCLNSLSIGELPWFILASQFGYTPLFFAAKPFGRTCSTETIGLLLDAGADVNHRDKVTPCPAHPRFGVYPACLRVAWLSVRMLCGVLWANPSVGWARERSRRMG